MMNSNSLKNLLKGNEVVAENKRNRTKKFKEEYYQNPKLCENCRNILLYEKRNYKFCSSSCSAKFNNVDRGPRKEQTKRRISKKMKGRKLSEEHKKKISEIAPIRLNDKVRNKIRNSLKEYFRINGVNRKPTTRIFSEKQKQECRERAKKIGLGGYNPNSIKKHKSGNYFGYRCDSSWELAYIIFNLENNIKFQRNTMKFDYEFKGKKKKWIPDFILDDGSFVEVKGYLGDEAKAKINSFIYPIHVIDKEKIKPYLEFVINKYGKDFTKLYVK